MAKVHLLSVDSPRPIAGTLAADCGREVKDSRMVAMFDSQAMGMKLEIPQNVCRKCVAMEKRERYVYGVCEARELKREEELYV